ncbi:MAG: phosphatase PAP2 family protein [Actinomycetota bacterium]|nr:phosphatase PAP2 family protein [Actinomycetota bacterium]
MTESSPPVRPARASARALTAGIVAIVLSLGGGGVISLLGNGPLPIDVAWFDFSNRTRSPQILAVSLFLNDAGAQLIVGVVVPIVVAILFALRRRGWAAVAVLLCGISSAPLVNGIKSVLERPRPDHHLVSVSLSAYPSGHVANLTAVIVVIALLLGKRWFGAVAVVLVAAMALSRTYLNVHWITDDIGGLLLGAGLALVVWGALAGRIRAEHPSPSSA